MKKDKSESKQIGVWMDHSEVKLFSPNAAENEIRTIQSPYQSRIRIEGEKGDGTQLGNFRSSNNEFNKHNKEQNEIHAFYRHVAEALLPYDDLFIFGPATAHNEFHNYLMTDKKFLDKKIVVEKSDYISENQMREKARIFLKNDVKI